MAFIDRVSRFVPVIFNPKGFSPADAKMSEKRKGCRENTVVVVYQLCRIVIGD